MQKCSIIDLPVVVAGAAMLASAGHAFAATTTPVPESPVGRHLLLPAALLAPASIEAGGAVIGTVRVNNGNVFDLENPAEDKALFRLANALHVRTRPEVITDQLLFQSGEPFSARTVEESARILRQNRYLQDASITPVAYENGVVDLEVATTDVWTLMPKLSLSRSGGANEGALGLTEMNLLGTGTAVEVLYRSEIDRDSTTLRFINRNLGHSWYGANVFYADSSDGHEATVYLGKPFYSLDSRDANGLLVNDFDRVEHVYDLGEATAAYRHTGGRQEIQHGWSAGLVDGWTKRFTTGVVYEDHRYQADAESGLDAPPLPGDRRLVYPFVGIEILEDRFETTRNADQIDRTEDHFLGTRVAARIGAASQTLGSTRDAVIVDAAAQTGFGSSEDRSLILRSSVSGRIEPGAATTFMSMLGASFRDRQSDHLLLYVNAEARYGHSLDLEDHLALGGDNGLRGYPLRYQTGDKAALLTIEQRYFTDWYPFRLFHVGGAVFFDVGRVWGEAPVPTTSMGLLRDVGVGLRIGQSRSGLGRMVHIDFAFPLDGGDDIDNFQVLVSTKKSF